MNISETSNSRQNINMNKQQIKDAKLVEFKSSISEKMVLLRNAKFALIEKTASNFVFNINKMNTKSEVLKWVTNDANIYGHELFTTLKDIWSRDSILEVFKSPEIENSLVEDSKLALSNYLNKPGKIELEDLSVQMPHIDVLTIIETNPLAVNGDELNDVIRTFGSEIRDDFEWKERFLGSKSFILVLGKQESVLQQLIANMNDSDWKDRMEFYTRENKSSIVDGGYKGFHELNSKGYYDNTSDVYMHHYLYWNYVGLYFEKPELDTDMDTDLDIGVDGLYDESESQVDRNYAIESARVAQEEKDSLY